jgi:hypothetical protein
MAAQWCHGTTQDESAVVIDCHGTPSDGGNADSGDCPSRDVTPDLGKLPSIAALPTGHDFALSLAVSDQSVFQPSASARPRGGPELEALCRFLI